MPRRKAIDQQALDALLQANQCVVRVSALVRAGLPRSTAYYRARPRDGVWQIALPGVLVTHNGELSLEERLRAALRYGGGGAILTGVAALRRYGLLRLPPENIVDLLIPHKRGRATTSFVRAERTRRMPAHRTRGGLPCAPPARALVDAARRIRDLDTVRALTAEVVQRRLCTIAELARELRDAQIRGTAIPRRVLREVADGVRSVAEARARELIMKSGLPQPVWNRDVFTEDGTWLAKPDAIWPELGLVLEIDSLEWHLSPAAYRVTQARQRRMAKYGLTVLPIAPSAVRDHPADFLEELRVAISSARKRVPPFVKVSAPAA